MAGRWKSWLWGVTAAVLVGGQASVASATLCLPPVFEGGQRLHIRTESRVGWLPLMFRQHEVCWRSSDHPGQRRVFLTGASGIYGFPLPADQTLGAELNREFARDEPGAHVFNLAHVYTYQVKDALILRHALDYEPDLIVHAINLDDFAHFAPHPMEAVAQFMDANLAAIDAMASEDPPGLDEPLRRYRDERDTGDRWEDVVTALRQSGAFVRLSAREGMRWLVGRWLPEDETMPPLADFSDYHCAEVERKFLRAFRDWKAWNIVAYLEQIDQGGTPVLIVNWPVAHEPRGGGRCYNVRFTTQAFAAYNEWLRKEVEERGLTYLDLHDFLPNEDFVDSYHPNAVGHRKLAERLEREIRRVLDERAEPADRAGA